MTPSQDREETGQIKSFEIEIKPNSRPKLLQSLTDQVSKSIKNLIKSKKLREKCNSSSSNENNDNGSYNINDNGNNNVRLILDLTSVARKKKLTALSVH